MSDFRTKAQEVYAQGVEERGNFTPSGTPLKIYQWWAKRSLNAPERENFCHFWRVVVIWAPLMWVVNKVEDLAGRKGVQVYSALVLLVVLGWMVLTIHSATIVALCVAGAIYMVTGVVTGIYIATPDNDIEDDIRINRKWARAAFVLTLPFAVAGFAMTKLVRAWRTSWTNALLITLFVAWVLWLLTLLVFAIINHGWIVLLVVFGVFAAAIAIVAAGVGITTYFAGRRAKRLAAIREARSKALEAFWAGEGPDPDAVEPREPSKISKFFSSVLDFAILVGQIIRVKKWKICPTVEVPKEA